MGPMNGRVTIASPEVNFTPFHSVIICMSRRRSSPPSGMRLP
ncbi:MAG: hypothetical protein ACLRMJ_03700 [Alistipes finegoldii]